MNAEPLKLLSSMAARELLAVLAEGYESANGERVLAEAAGGVDVANRVQDGEAADVVVLSRAAIDKLVAAQRLLPASCTDLAKSGVAIAVRAGAARPEVGNEEAVRNAVLAASSVSYSTGPSGVHLEKVFARWGILEQIRARIVVPPPGTPVGSLIADGRVQLGFQQLSELINLTGIDVLGPLPAAIQLITMFTGAIPAASRAQPRAAELLRFLSSPSAVSVKQRFGMDSP